MHAGRQRRQRGSWGSVNGAEWYRTDVHGWLYSAEDPGHNEWYSNVKQWYKATAYIGQGDGEVGIVAV